MIRRLAFRPAADLRSIRVSLRRRGWRETAAWLRSRDAPPTFQFAKYLLIGAASALVHLGLFALFSHTWFPAHDYLGGEALSPEIRERNAILANLAAFGPTVMVNYAGNVLFVFTSGRHSRCREICLFVLISFLAFAAGLLGGPLLISRGLNPWIAQIGLMGTSAIVNFACRKFLVFLR